jgi:hypothetical protein
LFSEKRREIRANKIFCPFHIDHTTLLPKPVEMKRAVGNYYRCHECGYGRYIEDSKEDKSV